jgi:hypothetical protein
VSHLAPCHVGVCCCVEVVCRQQPQRLTQQRLVLRIHVVHTLQPAAMQHSSMAADVMPLQQTDSMLYGWSNPQH